MPFKEVKIEQLHINPFTAIGDDWMLITAGTQGDFNTMTASWGGLGVFWNKNVATIYVRPQRYTRQFVDKNSLFTLSFFDEAYREALELCGSVSGRDTDKVEQAGLTPVFSDGTVFFEQAHTVILCQKLLHADVHPVNFDQPRFDPTIYPHKDYHRIYIAEILKTLVKD